MSDKIKQKRSGKPIQVYIDENLRVDFSRLVNDYDSGMGLAGAIRKLMIHALKDYWIPGYMRKEQGIERGDVMGNISPTKKPIENRGKKQYN